MSNDRTFVVGVKVTDAADFETFAAMAAKLKRHGRVEMTLDSLSGEASYDLPGSNSPWHKYTSYLSTLLKFFPHPKIAPFVDGPYVRKNQALLKACAKVMRKHKLGAAFNSHEPFFIHEKFFAKYPHLRGARVDHPRRSLQEAYAMCVDVPEAREMIAYMVGQLVKAAPELGTLVVHTNDAGAGLCWNDWIYSGPNGPVHCQLKGTGPRVASLVEAIDRGAGKKLDIHMHGNFSRNEYDSIPNYVDEHFYFHGRRAESRVIGVGTFTDNPVQGIIDAVGILESLERLKNPKVKKVLIGFSNNYSRSHNHPEAAQLVIDLVDSFLKEGSFGLVGRLNFLRGMCQKWVGKGDADTLLEALVAFHDALAFKQAALGRMSANYCGVSMRLMTRPLVAIPERLTPQEEAYFLPHVFNVRPGEGRSDYIDCHGGRLVQAVDPHEAWPRIPGAMQFCAKLNEIAGTLEGLSSGPAARQFRAMGVSLRIYSSIMRSIHNFYSVQVVRDRNKEKLAAPTPLVPVKRANWTGDPDLLVLNEFMRDELDNTTEFIRILENGGIKQVALAARPELEDTFLLGPDLLGQLKKKCQIMRRHWLDAEFCMASPHK